MEMEPGGQELAVPDRDILPALLPTEEQIEPSPGLPLRMLLTVTTAKQSPGAQQQDGFDPQPSLKTPGYPISSI